MKPYITRIIQYLMIKQWRKPVFVNMLWWHYLQDNVMELWIAHCVCDLFLSVFLLSSHFFPRLISPHLSYELALAPVICQHNWINASLTENKIYILQPSLSMWIIKYDDVYFQDVDMDLVLAEIGQISWGLTRGPSKANKGHRRAKKILQYHEAFVITR